MSPGEVVTVATGVQGAAGGDGYGVTFAGSRLLNVWHHQNGTITVDCHLRSTGANCPMVQIAGPYANPNNTPAAWDAVGQKLYTAVRKTTTNQLGFLCVDYSVGNGAACSTPFIPVSTTTGMTDQANIGGQAYDDDRIYVVDTMANTLHCLDVATGVPCANFAAAGYSMPTHPVECPGGACKTGWSSDISLIEGKVYYLAGSKLGCIDALANPVTSCNGSSPITKATSLSVPPVPVRDASGDLQMVCDLGTGSCIDPQGASATMPSAMSSFVTSLGSIRITYLYYSVFEWAESGNKLFWPVERGGITQADWANDAACFDFTTGSPCTGGDESGVKYDVNVLNGNASGRLYAFVSDPDPDFPCIWANGDAGIISSFGGDFGACRSASTLLSFSYDEIVPRMACAEAGRVRAWRDIDITLPQTVQLSDLRLTVKDSAATPQPIPGWDNITISSSTIDLTGLSVDDTGLRPTFVIKGINLTAQDMNGILAGITYVSDAPELCLQLIPTVGCGTGVVTGSRVPTVPFTVDGEVVATGPSSVSTAMSSVALGSFTPVSSSCGQSGLEGTARVAGSGLPLAGVTVRLVDPVTGGTLAETLTDAQGNFTFPAITVGTYLVEFEEIGLYSPTPETRVVSAAVVLGTVARADGLFALPIVPVYTG